MGMAGYILTNLTEIDIQKTINHIKSSLTISKCFYSIRMQKAFDNSNYGFIGVSEYRGADNSIVIYAYNRSKNDYSNAEFKCISSDLYEELYIEDISHSQYLLLRILHYYMESDNDVFFYIPAIDKLFNKDAIDKIYYSEKWDGWYLNEYEDTQHIMCSSLALISHSYVERTGLHELVLDKMIDSTSMILETKIHHFLNDNNYYYETDELITSFGITKNQMIVSIGHNEYMEVTVWKDADPMNEDFFNDISEGLGISIEIKYTTGAIQTAKHMLEICIEDKENYYVYSESHSAMTLSDFCNC